METTGDKGHQQGITSTNRPAASKLPVARTSVSKLVPVHKDRTDDDASKTAYHSRQQSGDSAHSSVFDDKVHSEQCAAVDEAAERHKKVEEWIQTTEGEDMVPQDMLQSVASPTFTDGSLSFSGLVGHQLTPKSAC